jgi:hypothetical protein
LLVGTYTWHAVYSGDANNAAVADTGVNESVVTFPAASKRSLLASFLAVHANVRLATPAPVVRLAVLPPPKPSTLPAPPPLKMPAAPIRPASARTSASVLLASQLAALAAAKKRA